MNLSKHELFGHTNHYLIYVFPLTFLKNGDLLCSVLVHVFSPGVLVGYHQPGQGLYLPLDLLVLQVGRPLGLQLLCGIGSVGLLETLEGDRATCSQSCDY